MGEMRGAGRTDPPDTPGSSPTIDPHTTKINKSDIRYDMVIDHNDAGPQLNDQYFLQSVYDRRGRRRWDWPPIFCNGHLVDDDLAGPYEANPPLEIKSAAAEVAIRTNCSRCDSECRGSPDPLLCVVEQCILPRKCPPSHYLQELELHEQEGELYQFPDNATSNGPPTENCTGTSQSYPIHIQAQAISYMRWSWDTRFRLCTRSLISCSTNVLCLQEVLQHACLAWVPGLFRCSECLRSAVFPTRELVSWDSLEERLQWCVHGAEQAEQLLTPPCYVTSNRSLTAALVSRARQLIPNENVPASIKGVTWAQVVKDVMPSYVQYPMRG